MTDGPPWSAPTEPPSSAPADLQTSPPTTHRKRRRSIAIGAALLGLAGLGVVGYFVFAGRGTASGATSPEAAVQGLIGAFEADDALGALTVVAPDEVDGVSAVLEAVQKSAKDNGLGNFAVGGDTDFHLDVNKPRVVTLSPNAARVQIDLSGSFKAAGTLGQLVGTEAKDFDGGKLRLITVKLNGGWFVSPMLTLGDYLVGQLDLPDGDYDKVGEKRRKTSAGTSASDAVDSLLHGAADFDSSDVSDALADGEARFVDVFAKAIDELLDRGQQAMAENSTSIDLADLGLEPGDDGSVHLIDAEVDYTTLNGSGTVKIEDDCVKTTNEYGDRNTGCILANAPFTSPLPETNLSFQTAKQSGAYRVQLLKSIAILAADVVARLDKQSILEALGVEVLDAATTVPYGKTSDASFDGERFKVFEVDVPADEAFTLSARSDDNYIGNNTYLLEDGRWTRWYFGGGEPTDKATKARIVVTADCEDYDSDALVFDCKDYATGPFIVAAQPVKTDDATFPGSSTVSLEPGQQASLAFSVDQATNATFAMVGPTGDDEYGYFSGPYSVNDNGTYTFAPGDYTLSFSNDRASAGDFTYTFEEVEAPDLSSQPTDISRTTPETTFDLSSGAYTEFGAYADAGDSVLITAVPAGGQDIVLNVASSVGDICSASLYGDTNGPSGSESCSFTVNTGGRFPVYVYGSNNVVDNIGTVTVTISIS